MKIIAPFNLRLSRDVAERLAREPGTKQHIVEAALRRAIAAGVLTARPLPRKRGVVQTCINLPVDLAKALQHLVQRSLLSAYAEQALREMFGMLLNEKEVAK